MHYLYIDLFKQNYDFICRCIFRQNESVNNNLKAIPHNAIIIKRRYSKEMKKQMNLSGLRDELAQVQTKKKEFLETMDRTHSAVLL